jgi:hypothetical protein
MRIPLVISSIFLISSCGVKAQNVLPAKRRNHLGSLDKDGAMNGLTSVIDPFFDYHADIVVP